ncbi:acyl CoA--acetate/3-ketoacid CoA transferase subunit beta [Desulfosporosinus meridiei]|uniref:Acyl CoA:acetate/3-ketoacid CoA transferase, beta subunit n=1 Tax=Desulfosporosinus meridiei (strain ATCC BAA-275 / DSM 13257 / KCTC 12902 / NCIMB 13706 / S10) TaxID=768704 RepID=J7J1A8_DESMD|nr:acyl CoA--acetate/3-ketoacid CoA transferase subunit beta [Desulfosporosinus meridiei]AFQ45103.1 acyl CoA:acetate/3-ketoacid CoA transferase, beta subunit [Desulfosporosinus meridiei DSM 13257]
MENKQGHSKPGEFKPMDLLACAAAREVKDGEIVFAGTGLPMLAIMVAQHTQAPTAVCIYESGSIDGRPIDLPTSVADARCSYQAAVGDGLTDVFGQLQSGKVDLAYLGGAEVDLYGNVNCTFMGGPTGKRLTGSGGNSDIHSLAKRSVLIMPQFGQKRRFVERVSYITSPGWKIPHWPDKEWVPKQEVYGPAFNGGPAAVISDMGVYRFDEKGEMYLDTVHPGFTPEECRENCSFDLNISKCKGETLTPTYEELELLYKVIDPEGIIMK